MSPSSTQPRRVVLADLPGRPCPAAAALELVGERWSLLVVRELSFGVTRFVEIVHGTGAPRDRIAARLRALVDAGVVERVAYQHSPPRFDYRLTPAGLDLVAVVNTLAEWGRRHAVAPSSTRASRAAEGA
ncbi:MAG: helix-turn-helix domain-containing protein [Nocardioides sp.]